MNNHACIVIGKGKGKKPFVTHTREHRDESIGSFIFIGKPADVTPNDIGGWDIANIESYHITTVGDLLNALKDIPSETLLGISSDTYGKTLYAGEYGTSLKDKEAMELLNSKLNPDIYTHFDVARSEPDA